MSVDDTQRHIQYPSHHRGNTSNRVHYRSNKRNDIIQIRVTARTHLLDQRWTEDQPQIQQVKNALCSIAPPNVTDTAVHCHREHERPQGGLEMQSRLRVVPEESMFTQNVAAISGGHMCIIYFSHQIIFWRHFNSYRSSQNTIWSIFDKYLVSMFFLEVSIFLFILGKCLRCICSGRNSY